MKIGFIGLGRMGANMVRRLLKEGHQIVAYNRSPKPIQEIQKEGAIGAFSIDELMSKLDTPKIIWLMIPAGEATSKMIQELLPKLKEGDILIDGGNSFYKDSMHMGTGLAKKKIHFVDVGTSGGIWGLKNGYCLMIGGEGATIKRLEPIFKSLAPREGYLHTGPNGSGHFVKMIHNAIEYGMLQAYGEGFEIMRNSSFELDFAKISKVWNHGSVVRSWLLELAELAFQKELTLDSIKAYVEDSGEGRWAVLDAIEKNVSAPVITSSLLERFRSRTKESFSAKFIAALRNEFGGHAIQKNPS